MTTRAAKLNELIDAIPGVCAGGRAGIRDLVAEITGEKLVAAREVTYRIGDRFSFSRTGGVSATDEYILAKMRTTAGTPYRVAAINLRTGGGRDLNGVSVRDRLAITRAELGQIFCTRYLDRIAKIADGSGIV